MNYQALFTGLLATIATSASAVEKPAPDSHALAALFENPPDSARPHTWWHWMNGNVTREGITADLEAMQRVGIGGFQAFHIDSGIPAGPVKYLSPEWRGLMTHAIREADRLGLQMCFHNCAGWSSSGGPWITPEMAMQEVVWTEQEISGPKQVEILLEQPTTRHDYYRDIVVLAFPTPPGGANSFRLEDWKMKAGFGRKDNLAPDSRQEPAEATIDRSKLLNLTHQVDPSGRLTWKVPGGNWTVIRFGHTPTGQKNRPAPPEGAGLECDKLCRAAAELHWKNSVQKVIEDVGPLTGKAFHSVLVDSYETGHQNWTRDFAEKFRTRMGYDLTPWLPTLTGRVVDTMETTERFLWDFRRVIADLFTEEYYGHFATMCHRYGLALSTEPYGKSGNFDDFAIADQADIPMGEWWARAPARWHHFSGKMAASAAHTHGRTYVGAEAFTAGGPSSSAAFVNHPAGLKSQGDYFFCQGVNRFIFHTFVHQPWLDVKPGMTMGPWGGQFNRNNTWFEPGRAWMRYLARCQSLLQVGTFQADLCYYAGEDSPQTQANRWELNPVPPAGYDYDVCSRETLMRMKVKDGQLMVPGFMQYRILVLPDEPTRPEVLRKVRELVNAGACVVGAPPKKSPGLQNYPACDQDVQKLVQEIWKPGQKKVFDAASLESSLKSLALVSDVEIRPMNPPGKTLYPGNGFEWIHRRQNQTDVYFLSNQQEKGQYVEAIFRVQGKKPELWDPYTGTMMDAPQYHQTEDGRIAVRLFLETAGSVFVIFQEGKAERSIVEMLHDGQTPYRAGLDSAPPAIQIHRAVYGVLDGTPNQQLDVTEKMQGLAADGRLDLKVGNELAGDPAFSHVKQMRVTYSIGGEEYTKTLNEKETLTLPEETAGGVSSEMPPAELTTDGKTTTLTAWQPGRYELVYSDKSRRSTKVPPLSPAIHLSGDWTLQFPPGWGAASEIKLDHLISWTEHADFDIKHFSGTAVYQKRFDMPESVIGAGKAVCLDLGDVQVMAEVILNGKNLGVFWKPPFKLDVTGHLKPKNNELEVRVTSLWANRLIGDAGYPDLGEWVSQGNRGKSLKSIPDWLLKDESRPPTERKTFVTWQHYRAKSPLVPSGLIGPVTLQMGKRVTFE